MSSKQLKKRRQQQQQQQQTIWSWAENLLPDSMKRSMPSLASSAAGEHTAPLAHYVQKAWRNRGMRVDDALGGADLHKRKKKGGDAGGEDAADPVPMLRGGGAKNRIVYYIGSFNPPHRGHLALADWVYAHSDAATDFNAVAVIVVAHGAYWIERKAVREARKRGGKAKGWKVKGGGQKTAAAEDPSPLVLSFERRVELLQRGVEELEKGENTGAAAGTAATTVPAPDTPNTTTTTTAMTTAMGGPGKRNWLWIFPDNLDEWWGFQGQLDEVCARDGFDLEFFELLGPDYVRRENPQMSGMNGVVTSNVCRPANFTPTVVTTLEVDVNANVDVDADAADIADAEAGAGVTWDLPSASSSSKLHRLSGFEAWERELFPGSNEGEEQHSDAHTDGETREASAGANPAAATSSRPPAEGGGAVAGEAGIPLQGPSRGGRAPRPPGRVWVCHHLSDSDYMIRFVECERPLLDPDMSSTKLRRILAESQDGSDENGSQQSLVERVRGIALCPELLVKFVDEERRRGGNA